MSAFFASCGDQRAGDAAVAQHGDPVGDLDHLVDVVRDEDDARALGHEVAHQAEQLLTSSAGRKGVGSSRIRSCVVGVASRASS